MPQSTRRSVISTIAAAIAAGLTLRSAPAYSIAAQIGGGKPQPLPSPNAPMNENVPAGLDGANIPWNHQKTILPATWIEIKSDAAKLLSMAADFKDRVDHTNLSATLPLPLIKEAHQIEKLAKKIQNRMKA